MDPSESETGSEEDVTGKPVACETATEKPYASSNSDCQGGPKAEKIQWPHNLHVSPATIHHTEAVCSIVREIYGREHDDPLDDLDVNMAIWNIFLNATLRAAVHLGQDYEANLRYVKNHLWKSVRQLFNENEKLIREQTEITGVSTINFKELTWMLTSFLCSRAYRITNAKTYVFSDSVSVWQKWEMILLRPRRTKLNGSKNTSRIWIESTVCRRCSGGEYSQESQRWAFSNRFNSLWKTYSANLSTSNTDHLHVNVQRNGKQKETKNNVNTIHRQLWIMLANLLAVMGLSWGLDQKSSGTEPTLTNPTNPGTKLQRIWWWISQIPVIQFFVPPVPLREENYEATERERSLYTSTVVKKPLNWFFARLFL